MTAVFATYIRGFATYITVFAAFFPAFRTRSTIFAADLMVNEPYDGVVATFFPANVAAIPVTEPYIVGSGRLGAAHGRDAVGARDQITRSLPPSTGT